LLLWAGSLIISKTMQKTDVVEKAQFSNGSTLFLLAMMAQLQLWDGIITQAFVACGLAAEGNRVAAHLLARGDYLPLKIAGILVCLALLWVVGRRYPALAKLTASVICIFYLAVIVWNFLVVFSG
jgi:hypothetical protein